MSRLSLFTFRVCIYHTYNEICIMHRNMLCQLSYDPPDLVISAIFLFADERIAGLQGEFKWAQFLGFSGGVQICFWKRAALNAMMNVGISQCSRSSYVSLASFIYVIIIVWIPEGLLLPRFQYLSFLLTFNPNSYHFNFVADWCNSFKNENQ